MNGTATLNASNSAWTASGNAVVRWGRRHRNFLLIVILPTLIVAAYYFLIASKQYESEADFMVREAESTTVAPSGLGQVLNLAGGVSPGQSESFSVSDYLESHDAVAALRDHDQLVERFRRPEADFISRLFWTHPKPETLLSYYRRHVSIDYSSDTGITTLRVRTFRPQDSYQIINALLSLGEQRVNELNLRSYQDTLSVAGRELDEAEAAVARSQSTMTSFRQGNRDVDPTDTSEAQIKLVSELKATLSATRAQLASMAGSIRPDSPQYVALAARERALEAQVGAQSSALAGSGKKTLATDLGAYEGLRLQQEFAAKRYDAAAAALEQARERAMKQQLFIVRAVEPNVPVKSTYPKRWLAVATVFFGLLLAYGVGWLIAAGVKEHAA